MLLVKVESSCGEIEASFLGKFGLNGLKKKVNFSIYKPIRLAYGSKHFTNRGAVMG